MKKGSSPLESASFWTTLPGILTAVATLITAIVGMIVALHQIRRSDKPNPLPTPQVTTTPLRDASPQPPLQLSAVADDITYTILSGRREKYSQDEYLLVLTVRVSCGSSYMNFEDQYFRLEVGGFKRNPKQSMSGHFVDRFSEWKEDLKFIVPASEPNAELIVGQVGTSRTAVIPLSLDAFPLTQTAIK